MRYILLIILALVGCSEPSAQCGGEGQAPCCAPPAVEDLVCDDGATLVHEDGEVEDSYMCRIAGEQGVFGDGLVVAKGSAKVNYFFGDEVWNCLDGRAAAIRARDSSCVHGCWDDEGNPSDHCMTDAWPACN